MIQDIANYFSDEALTFMILITSLILCAIAYLPVYFTNKQLNIYNKSLSSTPKKKNIPFAPKPVAWISKVFFVFFIIAVTFGYLKYIKDGINRSKYESQNYDLSVSTDSLTKTVAKLSHIDSVLSTNGKVIDQKGNIVNQNAPIGILDQGHGNSFRDVRTTIIGTGKHAKIRTYVGHAQGPPLPTK